MECAASSHHFRLPPIEPTSRIYSKQNSSFKKEENWQKTVLTDTSCRVSEKEYLAIKSHVVPGVFCSFNEITLQKCHLRPWLYNKRATNRATSFSFHETFSYVFAALSHGRPRSLQWHGSLPVHRMLWCCYFYLLWLKFSMIMYSLQNTYFSHLKVGGIYFRPIILIRHINNLGEKEVFW